eukprot:3588765-Rhodomonas_salina.2
MKCPVRGGICPLSVICYGTPGTDIAYGAVCLCACWAMSGTDIAYAATRWQHAIQVCSYVPAAIIADVGGAINTDVHVP